MTNIWIQRTCPGCGKKMTPGEIVTEPCSYWRKWKCGYGCGANVLVHSHRFDEDEDSVSCYRNTYQTEMINKGYEKELYWPSTRFIRVGWNEAFNKMFI